MVTIIIILLTTFLVPIILGKFQEEAEKEQSTSIYHFNMKLPRRIAYTGYIVGGIAILFTIFIIAVNQMNTLIAVLQTIFILFYLVVALAPTKGFWDTTIDGDDIHISRFWIFKRRTSVSKIGICERVKGGTHVYAKDGMTKLFDIDIYCTNQKTFFKRMEKEGIKVITRKEE